MMPSTRFWGFILDESYPNRMVITYFVCAIFDLYKYAHEFMTCSVSAPQTIFVLPFNYGKNDHEKNYFAIL